MTLVALALVLGLLLVSSLTLTAALMVSRRARQAMDKRVTSVASEATPEPGKTPDKTSTRASEKWTENVRAFFTFGMSRRWGMHSSALKLSLFAVVSGALTWFVFNVGLHFSTWVSALLAIVSSIVVPHMLLQMEQHRSELQFMDRFPDAIDMIVRMLRAGLPVSAAIRSVGKEAPSPVNAIFASLADQVEIGISFEGALNTAGERIGLTDFRFFAVAISLQRTSGGNLVTTLETLSDIIRRRRATRLKAKAATAEVRMSTYIIAAIPFLVIGGLSVLSPAYLTPLIVDPRGNVIVGISIGMLLAGFVTMRQMMRSAMRF